MGDSEQATTRPRNHASEIIISGNVWRAVWYVAWPTAVNTLIMTAYNIVNGVFVGKLPNAKDALAAVGLGGAALMIQFAITMGLSAGSSALVSQFVGRQNYSDADEAAGQSLALSAVAGLVLTLPFVFLARPMMVAIGAKGGVTDIAADYTAIVALSTVPSFVYFIGQALLRSTGDARSPLYAGAVTLGLNVLLDWVLIFGAGPIPKMGVHGAAIATGISRVAGMFVTLGFIRHSTLRSAFSHMRPRWSWFARMLKIGWPAAAQNLIWTGANAAYLRVLSFLPMGQATAAQAAYNVAVRIEAIAFMPGLAYGFAATPLVGQNLGAGKPDRAQHAAWVATGQAVFIMSAVAILFLTLPVWFARLFTHDHAVVPLAASYLVINAFSEPFLALGLVLRGALQGAGETRAPAWISFLALWVLRLPLAYVLSRVLGYGATGAWIAMSASTALSGLLVAWWFIRGSWRTVRV